MNVLTLTHVTPMATTDGSDQYEVTLGGISSIVTGTTTGGFLCSCGSRRMQCFHILATLKFIEDLRSFRQETESRFVREDDGDILFWAPEKKATPKTTPK